MLKNKVVILLTVIIAISLITTTVNACDVNVLKDSVYPMFDQINRNKLNISSLKNILYIDYSLVSKNPTSLITGSIHLERFSDGQWININTWSFTSAGSVTFFKGYKTETGFAYRVKVSATVNEEKITATSNIVQL